MKKICCLQNQKIFGVRNKLRFKKKMDNNWAPRKTHRGKVKKKLVTWGVRKKSSISKIG